MNDTKMKRISVTVDEALYERLINFQHANRLQFLVEAVWFLLKYSLDTMPGSPSKKEKRG